jgi:hypothetical protein
MKREDCTSGKTVLAIKKSVCNVKEGMGVCKLNEESFESFLIHCPLGIAKINHIGHCQYANYPVVVVTIPNKFGKYPNTRDMWCFLPEDLVEIVNNENK